MSGHFGRVFLFAETSRGGGGTLSAIERCEYVEDGSLCTVERPRRLGAAVGGTWRLDEVEKAERSRLVLNVVLAIDGRPSQASAATGSCARHRPLDGLRVLGRWVGGDLD